MACICGRVLVVVARFLAALVSRLSRVSVGSVGIFPPEIGRQLLLKVVKRILSVESLGGQESWRPRKIDVPAPPLAYRGDDHACSGPSVGCAVAF
ncbi:hypothetical protein GCM10022224_060150 [Nonomuraea antimicrobica]|uniref:Secreted protein n=1 Tax=Nonomuraea antimicrobica TaxID=561173 RepID=A0ABP7CFG1_9ACTN